MDFIYYPPRPLFVQAYAMFTTCMGGLLCFNFCRVFVPSAQAPAFDWLVSKAVEHTENPVPGFAGLSLILAALVAYRCAILGMPSFVTSQRWDGLPFYPPFRRTLPTGKVLILELLSDLAILQLTRQLLDLLWWAEAVSRAVMAGNEHDMIVSFLSSTTTGTLHYLTAPAYLMYGAATWELLKAYQIAVPDLTERPFVMTTLVFLFYYHLFC